MTTPKDEIIYDSAGNPIGSRPNHSDDEIDDKTRDIFPDTTSLYKAFVDRMPTPVEIQPGYWVMGYGNTLTAAKNASSYVNKTAKAAIQAYVQQEVLKGRIDEVKYTKMFIPDNEYGYYLDKRLKELTALKAKGASHE